MRRLFCTNCGRVTPTHPDDAALGFFSRYTHGVLTCSIECDQCAEKLSPGDRAVAVSQPADMDEWESDFMTETAP